MNLNKAMVIGNLTRAPESRTTPNGKNVTQFSVATSRVWVNDAGVKQEEVEYHNVVAWGKLGEICQNYLGKGRKVYVEGRMRTRDWVGKDGVKRNRTEIIAENMIMLDKAPAGSAPVYAPAAEAVESPVDRNNNAAVSEEEIKLEDIPF